MCQIGMCSAYMYIQIYVICMYIQGRTDNLIGWWARLRGGGANVTKNKQNFPKGGAKDRGPPSVRLCVYILI